MKCPKCGQLMKVTHTHRAGDQASTQRLECASCLTVCVGVSLLVVVDPEYGEGAKALAVKLKKKPLDRAALTRACDL